MCNKNCSAFEWFGAETLSVSVLIVPSSRIVILILSDITFWCLSADDFVLVLGNLFDLPTEFFCGSLNDLGGVSPFDFVYGREVCSGHFARGFIIEAAGKTNAGGQCEGIKPQARQSGVQ
jgi:hypothetical protein